MPHPINITRITRSRTSFTLLEVLIGMSILTAGVLAIVAIYPTTLRGNEMAELRTIGATLALMKVEEIRRDNDENDKLLNGIKSLTQPTEPVPFATEPRLAYRLSGTTVIYQRFDRGVFFDDPDDPRDDRGVARVLIQLNPAFRPGGRIIDEFRFDR